MKFTFGIITAPGTSTFLQRITDSICDENIPEFEIIIVGGNVLYKDDVMHVIPFDESKKRMWITKKKNIITENAKYDNIVYMHDYIVLQPGWYEGFLKFGDNFDICMTPIKNADGSRFRDWTLWFDDSNPDPKRLLPYDVTDLSKNMYISGAYWIAKKNIMKKFPLDESLGWGESEDVEWSRRVRETHKFSINTNSSVKLLKMKDPVFINASPEKIKELQNASV